MANGLFLAYREGILGEYTTWVDWDTDTIRVCFYDTSTVNPGANLATYDLFDDIDGTGNQYVYPTGDYSTAGQTLDGKTIGVSLAGAVDATDELFAAFSNGSVSVEGILGWKQGASAAASPLIFYFDTGVTGLPFTPSGGDVTIAWHSSGIYGI